MKGLAVLVVGALALGACQQKEAASAGSAPAEKGVVSVTGVVSGVSEKALRVRTDDGRVLDFALDDAVAVTLGGGESHQAVVTEGAPVRVSFKPKGAGADLVSIDVEPQAPESKGESSAPSADVPADPARARSGEGAAPAPQGGAGSAR